MPRERAPSRLTEPSAEYGRADVGPMILLRGAQIIHFGSLSGDQWDFVIAADEDVCCAEIGLAA